MTELNWVAWDGGPVLPDIAPGRTFWVKRRSGALGSYYRRSDAYWRHVGGPGDIVAYALVVEPEALQVTGNEAVNMSQAMEEHLAFNRRVNEAKPSKVQELKKRMAALEERVSAIEDMLAGTEKPTDGREWKMGIDLARGGFGRPWSFVSKGLGK